MEFFILLGNFFFKRKAECTVIHREIYLFSLLKHPVVDKNFISSKKTLDL